MSIIAAAVCDRCGNSICYRHIGKTYVIRFVREEGWSVARKEGKEIVLCPTCKRNRKEREKP